MKQLWYIHGANETPACFNYIKMQLPGHIATDIAYDCHRPLDLTLIDLVKQLSKIDEVNIIGHSYGGLLAVGASQITRNIKRIVALAAPFGGSESAQYLRFLFPTYGLFKNVSSHNPLLQNISKRGAVVPTLNIVATTGYNPLSAARNDGVITIESQKKLPKSQIVEVTHNHFEVLLADEVVALVKDFMWS